MDVDMDMDVDMSLDTGADAGMEMDASMVRTRMTRGGRGRGLPRAGGRW
jgi:hypothetical protein